MSKPLSVTFYLPVIGLDPEKVEANVSFPSIHVLDLLWS